VRVLDVLSTCSIGDAKRKRFGLKKKRSNTINLGHLLEHLKESTKKDKDGKMQRRLA